MSVTRFAIILSVVTVCACQAPEESVDAERPFAAVIEIRETRHEPENDLLSAGLGLDGLRGPAPMPADPQRPSPEELRRLAIHSNWRGLVDLTDSGGFGSGHPGLEPVPGREFHAFARLPDRVQPFRLLVQLPDHFDPDRPCLLVAPASGSRGIYGAHPVAAPWGLPRGCAIVYTDKGAGTDYFDHASDTGVGLDGIRAVRDGERNLGFAPAPVEDPRALISNPHAHSGENPEADWGRHVIMAAEFGLNVLNRQVSRPGGFSRQDTRIVAVGLSNGGGAVLRGIEQAATDLFDAALAVAPNITPPDGRALYDYATEAALYQPCILADEDWLYTIPLGHPGLAAAGAQHCNDLAAVGLLESADPAAARTVLETSGFDADALELAASNVALGLWRTVAAMYASAYTGSPADRMPCGYTVAAADESGAPAAAPVAERNLWWATSSGMVPGAGIELFDPPDQADSPLAALSCLRALWLEDSEAARTLHGAVEQTRATARLPDRPVLVIHGRQDGLIPAAFSARPYVAAARERGARQLAYWEIHGAQHFDVLVPLPGVAGRYVPLLPATWEGLDHLFAVLDGTSALGEDRLIQGVRLD